MKRNICDLIDGAVSLPFDVTGLPLLTEALLEQGFSEQEIRLFMDENVINCFLKSL